MDLLIKIEKFRAAHARFLAAIGSHYSPEYVAALAATVAADTALAEAIAYAEHCDTLRGGHV